MATYRHDLLVSLRLINRIEHETLMAEYEHWLGEEAEKCQRVTEMVATLEGGVKRAKGGTIEDLINKLEKLKQWRDGYCHSCESEMQRMQKQSRG
jgi:hypothetical protein